MTAFSISVNAKTLQILRFAQDDEGFFRPYF
jgi:hypothetical protein